MPPATIRDVCAKLQSALRLLDDPGNWKEANQLLNEARALLEPISIDSPRTVSAWSALAEIRPLLSPGASDSAWAIGTARAFLQVAIDALCPKEDR
jgi:hypothetical protein